MRWRQGEGQEVLGEGERGRISLGLFFLDLNDYIASLFIVLSRLIS